VKTVELQELPEGEQEQVRLWRLGALRRAGFDDDAAEALAGRQDVDLHFAIDLVRRGCSPEMASRILL
jgi:hypothetical protein